MFKKGLVASWRGQPYHHARRLARIPSSAHPLVRFLCLEMHEVEESHRAIIERAGVATTSWNAIREGRTKNPGIVFMDSILQALGWKLAIIDAETGEVVDVQAVLKDSAQPEEG